MGTGFEVTPRRLRTAAKVVRRQAVRLGGVGMGVQNAAAQAAAVNPTYLTSAAAVEVATEVTRALTAAAEGLASHAGGLGNSSVTYQSTEDRNKWMMERVKQGVPEGATYA